MKKFITITPDNKNFESIAIVNFAECNIITRFPLMALINAYAKRGEEIRVITVTPDTNSARIHEQEFRDELVSLQEEQGFVCRGVEAIPITYAGDVDTSLELFRKLLPVFEEGDTLYACLTFGNKPMIITELMAIEYAYRVMDDVAIGCLVYGDIDRNVYPAAMWVHDITSLIRLDEIVRLLAERRVANPTSIIQHILAFSEEA